MCVCVLPGLDTQAMMKLFFHRHLFIETHTDGTTPRSSAPEAARVVRGGQSDPVIYSGRRHIL